MPIHPIISEQFNGDIWRMEIDELTDTIFIEVRDNNDKKVHFAAVNLLDGTVLFNALETPERWLTGIEAAYDGVLLLHFYQTETGPTHKGLMAINAANGKMLWSNYAVTFDYLSVSGPVVYDSRIHPRKLFLTDIKTGATLRIYQPSVYAALKNNVRVPTAMAENELPLKLAPTHPFGNELYYFEHNNFRIVSLHALKAGALNQWLYIFDGEEKIYEDLLNASIQKLQPESFIIHQNRLIYIKNKSELKVVPL